MKLNKHTLLKTTCAWIKRRVVQFMVFVFQLLCMHVHFSVNFDTAMESSKYVLENIDSIEFRRYKNFFKNFVSFKKDLKLILKIRLMARDVLTKQLLHSGISYLVNWGMNNHFLVLRKMSKHIFLDLHIQILNCLNHICFLLIIVHFYVFLFLFLLELNFYPLLVNAKPFF